MTVRLGHNLRSPYTFHPNLVTPLINTSSSSLDSRERAQVLEGSNRPLRCDHRLARLPGKVL